ncbi:MAG TPA: AbrB/MazE/SpoVT family DNA-binding domain-containing protein [Acidobacteriota bacterium]|nr:AbrB/MazE/SpoVT family DNA-binding domain-containing protein [Acidobacteriota bacterium]
MTKKVKISTKGQLVIPQAFRERHGWGAGTVLIMEDEGDRIVVREAPEVPETDLEELLGCTGYQGPPRSLEEMEAGIAKGIAERTKKP